MNSFDKVIIFSSNKEEKMIEGLGEEIEKFAAQKDVKIVEVKVANNDKYVSAYVFYNVK